MELKQAFFADSYAIIDFFKGNKGFARFFEEEEIITTKLNLMEVYYWVLSDFDESKAEEHYSALLPFCIDLDDSVIKEAMKLRLRLKKQGKNVSYVDCIGYQFSLALKIKLLTGDREFKSMPNPEFIK